MNISDIDRHIKSMGDFQLHDFCILRELRIHLCPQEGAPVINMQMKLIAKKHNIQAELMLKFIKITSLVLDLSAGNEKIHGFRMENISDRKLEDISWQVFDYEDKTISFYAKDIEIINSGTSE